MTTRDDTFWAEYLGIDPADWSTTGVSFRPHAALTGYRGFWCFRRNDRVAISAPPRWVERLRVLLSGWNQDRHLHPEALAEALGADAERTIGPVFQGRLEPQNFTINPAPRVRRLLATDAQAVDLFRSECGNGDWEISGLTKAELSRHAYFQGDRITALAGYRPWREGAGDPCVLTHPEFRGNGCGAAVTSAVVADALSNGKLLLYQTLESNEAAIRIARSLGYERYGQHVAVRLRRDAPES